MANVVEYILNLRDNLSGPIDSANSRVNNFERSLGSVKSTAMSLGSVLGVTFGVAGIALFAKSMVDAGSKVENAKTGLTTLLKNAVEAQGVIDNTMKDATQTPFAFEGLLSANKALIGAGVESKRAREDVLNLANAIAATGGGDNELQRMVVNLQQISNTGKATALDIKQFAFAGVNIYKVLEAAGIKANDKGKESAITYDQITMALKKAHEAGGIYANGLENMAGNTSVQISNLGDAFFQLSVKMFNDLKPAIEWVVKGMFSFIETLRKAWDWGVKNKDMILSVAKSLGIAFLAFKAMTIIPAILLAVENGLVAAATGATAFGGAMSVALGPIGLMTAAVGALALAFNMLSDAQERNKKGEQNLRDLGKKQAIEDVDLQTAAYEKTMKHDEALKLSKEKVASFYEQKVIEMQNAARGMDPDSEAFRNLQGRELSFGEAARAAREYNGLVPVAKTLGSKPAASTALAKTDSKTKATGSRSITINVSIKDLIGVQNINTTNLKEGAGKIKEQIVAALTGAVNDFQIVAGQ